MICVLQPYLKFLFDEFSISRFTLQFLSEPPGYANAWEFERNEKVAMVARRNLHISYLFRPLGVTAMNYGDNHRHIRIQTERRKLNACPQSGLTSSADVAAGLPPERQSPSPAELHQRARARNCR
jgi:hypothetical protein